MIDLEQRRADRLRVMRLIFDEADGTRHSQVSGQWLLETSGLGDDKLGDICAYLIAEHLIENVGGMWGHYMPHLIMLAHRGIKEMERSLEVPDTPTEHFPPLVSVIHIEGDLTGSPIQIGSPGATQQVSMSGVDLDSVRTILARFESVEPELGLSANDAAQLAAEMMTVKAQSESPSPNHRTIREHLSAAGDILKLTAGGAAAAGLIDLITYTAHH
jgi:hypothetical protein